MNFVEELKWRGMIAEIMPGTEEQLSKERKNDRERYDAQKKLKRK